MKKVSNPVRTTIVFGLLCALGIILQTFIFGYATFIPIPPHLAMGLFIALYGLLMARWSGVGPGAICFPVLIIFSGTFLTRSPAAFLMLMFMVFSWIRSGICFKGSILKRILAEVLLCGGAGGGLIICAADGPIAYPLWIWMFFLVQSLYFLCFNGAGKPEPENKNGDPFESARKRAERILSTIVVDYH